MGKFIIEVFGYQIWDVGDQKLHWAFALAQEKIGCKHAGFCRIVVEEESAGLVRNIVGKAKLIKSKRYGK